MQWTCGAIVQPAAIGESPEEALRLIHRPNLFHLAYCFDSTAADTIDLFKEIAVGDALANATFKHLDNMPSFDSRPDGFAAHYAFDKQTVTVVFFALNLGQRTQKAAANEAANSVKSS